MAELTGKGRTLHFIVSNLAGDNQHLYNEGDRARCDMENRNKEQQLGLFDDRTSVYHW
ncbi:MAG: transposase [Candidatus Thiodiazotropha sp. (ex. Lucinisca nassula)]|nr:transposase [Candidatus Thiodiazotropha sp. (ex. Lucinisca nassula)]MBW9275978.1 transposase [Candidatus Thiodiazotropha sp. (ex. Lucinisca nassula)]PUB82228.1 MAG: hypothetical protein DBP02_15420 [gamma proteobacterium symbiont of Ctena orbiculata]PUB91485.1 MAG: hypothetical protein DBP01_02100 [gamma proteobacterium symbiont of Ctena orbiculata]